MVSEVLTVKFQYSDAPPLELDFSRFRLPRFVLHAFRDTYEQVSGGHDRPTAVVFWTNTKAFLEFLESRDESLAARGLPVNLLELYRKHAVATWGATQNANTHCNNARTLLRWLKSHRPRVVSASVATDFKRIVPASDRPKPRDALGEDDVRKILACCYSDIREFLRHYDEAHHVLEACRNGSRAEGPLSLAKRLLTLGRGYLPKQKELSGSLKRSLFMEGGLEQFRGRYFLTSTTFLPFYIAIAAQTAGNPRSIRAMKRDCLTEHDLFVDRYWIRWPKKRARRKEQNRDFQGRREMSAPNLIKHVLRLTRPLVARAPGYFKKYLFLTSTKAGVSCPSVQQIQNELHGFCARHGIPYFVLSQLRRHSGEAHREKFGILAAKKVLNHQSVRDTVRYVEGSKMAESGRSTVLRFQGKLISAARGKESIACVSSKSLAPSKPPVGKFYTTFGFQCSNPFAGIAPGTKKGRLCEFFMHCAVCAGCVVPLDDVGTCSRFIQARDHLSVSREKAVLHGWEDRFRLAHEPTLLIITDLLEDFDPSVREQAKALVHTLPPLPDIE